MSLPVVLDRPYPYYVPVASEVLDYPDVLQPFRHREDTLRFSRKAVRMAHKIFSKVVNFPAKYGSLKGDKARFFGRALISSA